jgi:hypothetical protein
MGWRDMTGTEHNAEYECHLYEELVKDDTAEYMGAIMQFYAGHPYYALLIDRRLGPHETLEGARAAVENPENARPLALFIPPKTHEH